MKLNSYININYRFLPIYKNFLLNFKFIYNEYYKNGLFESYKIRPNDLKEQNKFFREGKIMRKEI